MKHHSNLGLSNLCRMPVLRGSHGEIINAFCIVLNLLNSLELGIYLYSVAIRTNICLV